MSSYKELLLQSDNGNRNHNIMLLYCSIRETNGIRIANLGNKNDKVLISRVMRKSTEVMLALVSAAAASLPLAHYSFIAH